MTPKLYPYQKTGIEFLKARRHAMLADTMGMGKTAQAIIAAQELGLKKILVICPATAKINWQREFIKWAGRKSRIVDSQNFTWGGTEIGSFDHVTQHIYHFLKTKWDLVIVDEAHFLKEPSAQRTKAILSPEGLAHKVDKMWLMSGTPAPNHAGEMWIYLYTFGFTKLSYEGFLSRYCRVTTISGRSKGKYYERAMIAGTNTKNSPELKRIAKPYILRRKKLPGQQPPISHYPHYIDPADLSDPLADFPNLKSKIKEEMARLQEAIGFDYQISDEKLLLSLQAMSQSVSSLRRYHGLQKIGPAARLISDELELGLYRKIVVFGIHRDVLKTLHRNLAQFNPQIIVGGMSDKVKQAAIDTFQDDQTARVFIGNIKAAGTAINLTAAHQGLGIERDWVPGNNAQAYARMRRIGQTKPVTFRHLTIANSFDDKLTALLIRKIKEISTFID